MALPEDRGLADELFADALEVDTRERAAFVERACAGDAELRREVEARLALRERMGTFLAEPAAKSLPGLAPPPPLAPGDAVGAYRIVRVIGAGGAGTVYEAEQSSPHRRVAIKVMRADLASPRARERFGEEAEILARLHHPGIAHVYEAGVCVAGETSLPYFVMEYVEAARSVVQHAAAEGLGPRRRLGLMADICDAVHHGHQKGVIHRDLKPGNVLVGADGRPKVIDFGIARVADQGGPGGTELAGTLPYMSPEQFDPSGSHVDVRTDVYALGVLLYELLTGRLPYEVSGLAFAEARARIERGEPVPAEEADPRLRGDVAAILRRALAKDRDARYPSAAALAEDLRRHLTGLPVDARPHGLLYVAGKLARRQRVAFSALAALFVVAVGAAVGGGWLAYEKEQQRRGAEMQAYRASISAASAALRVNDVGDARQSLDAAPKALRGWEWRHLRGRLDQSERTIRWVGGQLQAGVVTPDGTRIAATLFVGSSGLLRVWDREKGEPVYTAPIDAPPSEALAMSPDGSRLAIGSDTGTVEIRDAATGAVLISLEAHDRVNAMAFDHTGELLATGGRDRTVKIWDGAATAPVRVLEGHEDRVVSLAFGPGDRRLASGGRDGTIRIFDAGTGATLRAWRAHDESVESVDWSADGTRLATGSRDHTARLWDAQTGHPLATLHGHTANVRWVAFRPDGALLATAGWDATIRLWGVPGGEPLACLRGHTGLPVRVGYEASGRHLFSFGADGSVKCWSGEPRDEIPTLRGHRDRVLALAFSGDGRLLASGSRDGEARIWDVSARTLMRVAPGEGDPARSVAFVNGDSALVVAGRRSSVRLVEVSEGAGGLPEHWPVATARENDLLVRDAATGEVLRSVHAHQGFVASVAVDAEGRALASGDETCEVCLWDLPTLERRASLPLGHRANHFAFSPSGDLLATACSDGAVRVLAVPSMILRTVLQGHTDDAEAVAFSPDGNRLASGGRDHAVRLWDTATWEQVAVLHGHRHAVLCVAFSPDGRTLASGGGHYEGRDTVILLWEAGQE